MVSLRNYKDSDYADVKHNLEEAKLFVPMWDTRECLEEKIRRNTDSIIVAEEDGAAIGNLFIMEDGWGAFIFHTAVRSSYRGRGISQKLMQHAEEYLKRKGAKAVSLFVDASSEKKVKFCKMQGYLLLEKYVGMYKMF